MLLTIVSAAVFALCVTVSIPRFFAARRGRNLRMSVAAAILLFGIGQAITPIYEVLDPLMGGSNLTTGLAHLLIGPAFYALGSQVMASLKEERRLRLLTGPVGMVVMGVNLLGTAILFWAIDAPESSRALMAYTQDPFYGPYNALSFLYASWTCALLIGPCWRAGKDQDRPRAHQLGYKALGAGFTLALPMPVLYLLAAMTRWGAEAQEASLYTAVVAVAVGVTAAAIKSRRSSSPLAPLAPRRDLLRR
jgi:hypothetical protein